MGDVKDPIEGYARCETVLPVMGGQIMNIPGMPTRRAMVLKTMDGNLALGVTADIMLARPVAPWARAVAGTAAAGHGPPGPQRDAGARDFRRAVQRDRGGPEAPAGGRCVAD